jgi:hypothetical protein
MKTFEINKYPPSLFKKARFLQSDWTSCADLENPKGKALTREEFLRTEELYISAALLLAESVDPSGLRAHSVEFWDEQSPLLTRLGLEDVFDGSAAPIEGEELNGSRLRNAMRRCFREVAWLEFTVEPVFLLHFGYDLRLVVATETAIEDRLATVRERGLFVYDSVANVATLEEWASRK